MRLKPPITYIYSYLLKSWLLRDAFVDAAAGVWRSPSGHRELLHTNKFILNSLSGYADGTSPSNWLNDKGVARPGCFLWKPITHTCAFRRASKNAPDVVKEISQPRMQFRTKTVPKRNLDSTSPKGTRPGTFPRHWEHSEVSV